MSVLLEQNYECIFNKPKNLLKKQSVTDRQMERQKMKNSISPQKQFSVPISHVLIPPSSNDNIFSCTGVHVQTIDFTFSYLKQHYS